MSSRDLEVISTYFKELLNSAPHHEERITTILKLIDEMKIGGDHALNVSVLLSRDDSDDCSICGKKVVCYD